MPACPTPSGAEPGSVGSTLGETKRVLRRRLLTERRALDAASRQRAGLALAAALQQALDDDPRLRALEVAAAYVSLREEPHTAPLIETLQQRGVRVLLPILRADDDLDWGWAPGGSASSSGLAAGRRGLLEPTSSLGVGAIGRAGLVLVPGLAAGPDGTRLGRGGGSYDRALTRVRDDALVAVVLYESELLDAVPAEPHDRPVDAALTPAGLHRFAR